MSQYVRPRLCIGGESEMGCARGKSTTKGDSLFFNFFGDTSLFRFKLLAEVPFALGIVRRSL